MGRAVGILRPVDEARQIERPAGGLRPRPNDGSRAARSATYRSDATDRIADSVRVGLAEGQLLRHAVIRKNGSAGWSGDSCHGGSSMVSSAKPA